MFNLYSRLIFWPANRYGRIYLRSTDHAFEYASLIYLDRRNISQVWADRFLVHLNLRRVRFREPLNYQLHMELVVEGQFLRECLEEVVRLRSSHLDSIRDLKSRVPLSKVA
jgi:hypothetical protein